MRQSTLRAIVGSVGQKAALGVGLVLAIALSPAHAAPCSGFTDLDTSSGFCGNVAWLKNRSITFGCTATTYCPGDSVSRLQMAAFMNRLGTALTPEQLSVDAAPGAIDLDASTVVCQTAEFVALGFERVAYADVTLSATAGAAVDVAADLVMSLDNGANWNNLNLFPNRGFVPANRWGLLTDIGFANLAVGQGARWGVRVTRGGIAGGTDLDASGCQLRVRVYGPDVSAPPVVKVFASIANASETGPSHGQFTVSRTGGNLAAPLVVPFALGGTATNCFDYACIQSITIAAAQTSVQVPVTVLQDTLAEGTETVFLNLVPDASIIIGTPSAVVSIANGTAPTNLAPSVSAGSDQTITLPASASLAGSASDDGNPNPPHALTVSWSVVSGPGTVSFGNANAAATSASFSTAGTYVLRLTANDGALNDTSDVTITVNPVGGLVLLQGPPGDPANNHIPNILLPDPPPGDLVAPNGIPISVRDLLVNFKDSATVSQVNALLQTLQADVAGGIPAGKLLFLRLVGPSNLDRVLNGQQMLLASPLVSSATINFGMAEDQLPPFNVDPTNLRWTWELPFAPASGNWGFKKIRMPQAWNLIDRSRRLGASIDVAVLEAGGVISGIDPNHVDIQAGVNNGAGQTPSEHATMVGGMIGAVWNNNAGVEGVYPRPHTLVSRSATFVRSLLGHTVNAVIGLLLPINVQVINYSVGVGRFYNNNGIDPVTAAVNPAAAVSPANPTWRGQMDNGGNTFLNTVRAAETSPAGRSSFLMFCTVGNLRVRPTTALDYDGRDNSVCANVAARGVNPDAASPLPGGGTGADHFVAVEAMDSTGNRSIFSGSGGMLSAPGSCVRSLEFSNGVNYDAAGCAGTDATDANNATQNGTSFASPMAAGLATYLWSLNQGMTYQQLRQLMTAPANRAVVGAGPLGGNAGSESIDAFAAAVGIDLLFAADVFQRKAIQRALVDVDDGTADGNTRIDPFTGTVDTTISYPDLRRGDGFVSIQDFRAWRDAYLQVNLADLAATGIAVALDGGQKHFKKDLNFDGCVAAQTVNPSHPADVPTPPAGCIGAPLENVYPRYDFNGDGQVGSWFKTTGFQVDPDSANPDPAGENRSFTVRQAPGFLRDIDVMAEFELWAVTDENVEVDPAVEGLSAPSNEWGPRRFLLGNRDAGIAEFEDIPDYLHSFDLHLMLDWTRINGNYEAVKIEVKSEMVSPYSQTFDREITVAHGQQPTVVTLPIWTGSVKITFTPIDNVAPNVAPTDPGYLPTATKELAGARFGEDRGLVHPRFPVLIDDIAPGRTNIAVGTTGTIFVAYERQITSNPDGSEIRDHWFARSTDGGITWSATQIATGEQRRRDALAVGGVGNVYIAHVLGNPSQPAPIGNASVQLIRSSNGGVSFTPQVISTAGTTNVDFHTDVATDAAGKVYVVWAESGTNAAAPEAKNPYMIRMRTSINGGATFSAPTTIHSDPSPGALWYPRGAQIAVTPDGQQIHVTWTQCIQTDGSGNCLNLSLRYSRSVGGSAFSAPVQIAQSQFLTSFYELAVDPAGNVSVVFPSSSASPTVTYVRVENGATVRTVDASLTPPGFSAFAPRLAIDGFGAVWITWFEGSNVVPSDVFVIRTSDGGVSFAALQNISKSPSVPSGASAIGSNHTGAPLIVWGEQGATHELWFRPVLSP